MLLFSDLALSVTNDSIDEKKDDFCTSFSTVV